MSSNSVDFYEVFEEACGKGEMCLHWMLWLCKYTCYSAEDLEKLEVAVCMTSLLLSDDYLKTIFFNNNKKSEILCQSVRNQIRLDVLSGLIWVQTVLRLSADDLIRKS